MRYIDTTECSNSTFNPPFVYNFKSIAEQKLRQGGTACGQASPLECRPGQASVEMLIVTLCCTRIRIPIAYPSTAHCTAEDSMGLTQS